MTSNLMKRDYYNVGDYVKYEGDSSTLEDRRRNPDFAKILQIEKFDDYWWVGVELLSSKEKISFSMNYLRPISLEEKHLVNLGFEKRPINLSPQYYVKGDVYISSIGFNLIILNYHFISGFCLVDNISAFQNLDIADFFENNKFNTKKFYEKYPSLYNINSLIEVLKEKSLINDDEIEELITMI